MNWSPATLAIHRLSFAKLGSLLPVAGGDFAPRSPEAAIRSSTS